jgi:hypothetical protein
MDELHVSVISKEWKDKEGKEIWCNIHVQYQHELNFLKTRRLLNWMRSR